LVEQDIVGSVFQRQQPGDGAVFGVHACFLRNDGSFSFNCVMSILPLTCSGFLTIRLIE
jgi:hypothetical protein